MFNICITYPCIRINSHTCHSYVIAWESKNLRVCICMSVRSCISEFGGIMSDILCQTYYVRHLHTNTNTVPHKHTHTVKNCTYSAELSIKTTQSIIDVVGFTLHCTYSAIKQHFIPSGEHYINKVYFLLFIYTAIS